MDSPRPGQTHHFPLTSGVSAVLENANFMVFEVPVEKAAKFELVARQNSKPEEIWAVKCVVDAASFSPTDLSAVMSDAKGMGLKQAMIVGESEFHTEVKDSAKKFRVLLTGGEQYKQSLKRLPETVIASLQQISEKPAEVQSAFAEEQPDPVALFDTPVETVAAPSQNLVQNSPQIAPSIPSSVKTGALKPAKKRSKKSLLTFGAVFMVFAIVSAFVLPKIFEAGKPVDVGSLRGLKKSTWGKDILPVEQAFYSELWALNKIPENSEFKALANAMLKRGHFFSDALGIPNQGLVIESLFEQIDRYPHLAYALLPGLPEVAWYELLPGLLQNPELAADPVIHFHLCCMRSSSTRAVTDYEKTFKSLESMLNHTDGLSSLHPINTYNIVSRGHADGFRGEKRAEYVEVLSKHPRVPEWLKNLETGTYHFNRCAYQKDEGTSNRDHAANLEKARDHLEKAWQQCPESPVAASLMIGLSKMAFRPIEEKTLWFERTIEIQVDYPDAYDRYLNSLRPYWAGHELLQDAFGRICLEKSKTDPALARYFKQSHLDRLEDHKGDKRFYWTALSEQDKAGFAEYETRIDTDPKQNYTFMAGLWCALEDFDRMMVSLRKINFQLDEPSLEILGVEPVEIQYQINQLKG